MTDPQIALSSSRYTVERELGRGGMGVVLLARDHSLDRLVAIKLLPAVLAAQGDLRERFLREVRIAASLSHPNIVPIFSVDESDESVYYVMGYIDGETLTQRVRRLGPLPPADVGRVLQESAWALGYAHGRGIIHRDVKPDNIMIERASGRTFVTDFGIARAASSAPLTSIGETLGTPHFMSPEQAAGEPLDQRSDIYSLGAVGYFALTGTLPFDAPSVQAILAMHLTKPATPVASVRAGVPPLLAEAVDRCLAKEPAQRFESGDALSTAIQGAQVTRAEVAPPVRMFQRMAEMSVVQLLTVLLMVVVIGTQASRAPAMTPLILLIFLLSMLVQLRVRARALLDQGFLYEDVRAAFLDEARERSTIGKSMAQLPAPKLARTTIVGVIIGIATLVGGLALGVPSKHGTWQNFAGHAMILAGVAIAMIAIVSESSFGMRVGSKYQGIASKLWLGSFGRLLFRLAARGGAAQRAALETRRLADSQSLATLVAALESRPKAALGDAPAVIDALERRARDLEAREREIDAALADARRATVTAMSGAVKASRDALLADLDHARDAIVERRAKIAAALEGFRVTLIRMRAGIGDASLLRAHLESANQLLSDGE